MSLSSIDPRLERERRHVPPPHRWDPFRSVHLQALAALSLAGLIYAALHTVLSDAMPFTVESVQTYYHEASHALVGYLAGGDVHEIVVNPDGSGHAVTSVTGPVHRVMVSGAGMVLPAWFGAFLLASGITRQSTDVSLWAFALIIGILGALYVVAETNVMVALFMPAAAAGVVAFLPANGFVKSVATLVFALMIAHGVFNSHEYAFVDWIDNDHARPSDAMKIALALGADGVAEVGAVLIGLIIAGYVVALIWTFNWLQRHTR